MAHISSIGAAMFTDLSVSALPKTTTNLTAIVDGAITHFGTEAVPATVATPTDTQFIRITHIKEFPAIGTPANVVKVPEYGAKTSKQIQGQADSPTMEITLNYVPGLWADSFLSIEGATAGTFAKSKIYINDGNIYLFRFSLLALEPEGYLSVANGTGDENSIGSVGNSSYYFLGKFEALEVTPSLTDALSAKLTITVQSDIRGAYTVSNV
jgi:hypothetical protein